MDSAPPLGAQVRAAVALLLALWAIPADAANRYAVIISGAAGGEKYAAQQQKWRAGLAVALKTTFTFDDANVVVLDEESKGTSKATADNVRRLFDDLRRRVN